MRRIILLIIGLVLLAFPVLAQDTPDFSDLRAAIEANSSGWHAPTAARNTRTRASVTSETKPPRFQGGLHIPHIPASYPGFTAVIRALYTSGIPG